MPDVEPFKNLLSAAVARDIAKAVKREWTGFKDGAFHRGMEGALAPLELKARMLFLADRLEQHLPKDPAVLFPILIGALSRGEEDSVGLKGFAVWPLTEIVARRGGAHFDGAMEALREMTRRFTGEFAMRPFLRDQQERTLRKMLEWTRDPDEHVRRLASEGSRPILPWGEKLPALLANPSLTLRLLERLREDPSEYVRRSVANHLNDFSRSHPEHVIAALRSWGREPSAYFSKLAARAARTLIKQGHPEALELVGISSEAKLEFLGLALLNNEVAWNGAVAFRVRVQNTEEKEVAVLFDYAIHFARSSGGSSRKVFKGRRRVLLPGEIWEFDGVHAFRTVTTRRHYPGKHGIEPMVNGRSYPAVEFALLEAKEC